MTKISKIDQKERFVELRAKGVSYDDIVKEIGVSKPTLIKWGRELELEISNLKALEWEALQEKHFVSKAKRVELYGQELTRLNEEIGKRDYTEMSLKDLIELKLKCADKLKAEETEIRLKEKGTFEDTLVSFDNVIVEWKA